MPVKVNLASAESIAAAITKELQASVRGIAETIVEVARDNTPVDTGNLKRSIRAEVVEENKIRIETRTGYGAYVELGTSTRAATPYLAPAVTQVMDRVKGQAYQKIISQFDRKATS